MYKTLKTTIDSLDFSDSAKEVLRRTLTVSISDNTVIKRSVKSLFVTCPANDSVSEYAKLYEKIITSNHVYSVTGKGTYLELALPNTDNDKTIQKFFLSPTIVAATLNTFAGVFLISFEQWTNFSLLSKSSVFSELLDYIDNNRTNTSFVFHVKPDFSGKEDLRKALSGHINLEDVSLELPTLDAASEYLEKSLSKADIYLDSEAKTVLPTFIGEIVNNEKCAHWGYSTINRLANSISYEVYCMNTNSKNNRLTIDRRVLDQLSDKIDFSLAETSFSPCKLGFN